MSRNSHNTPFTLIDETDEIARAQGVKPPDFDQLMSGEPILPDDETADMLIEAVRAWRKEDTKR
ncbi:MAG: hypothetical protein ACREDR_11550 [Blastocatellia bacterium]